MDGTKKEQTVKAILAVVALLIATFSIGVAIKQGSWSSALVGIGFSAFVFGYSLSPKFLLASFSSGNSSFSKVSSNIVLLGSILMLLGWLLNYVAKT